MKHKLAYGGLLLFTLVLYVRPNDFLPIGDFQIAKIVAIGALAAFVIERATAGQAITILPRESKYLLALTALMFLSVPLALDPGEAVETIFDQFIKVVLVFVLLVNVLTSYARLRRMMGLTVLLGGGLAVATLRGFSGGEDLVGGYRATGVVGGIFGNPNDLALALTILIPLAIGLALTSGWLLTRLLYLASAAIMVAAVFTTYSRAGFVTLLVLSTYILLTIGRRHATATLLIVLAGLALITLGPVGYDMRVLSIFDPSLDLTGSAGAREDLLWRSLQVVSFNPKVWLVGVGAGNFHIVSIHEGVTHNTYLQVLTEIGLPALVLYILFLTRTFRGLSPLANSASSDMTLQVIAIAIRGSLLAYVVGSLFASVAYQWYLYYPAGYAICLRRMAAEEGRGIQKGAAHHGAVQRA